MRYHIDTIPVWDALKQQGECPLCALRRSIEAADVDRFLGGSVIPACASTKRAFASGTMCCFTPSRIAWVTR